MSSLFELPEVLSHAQMQEVRGLLAAAPWHDGRASAGEQAAQVKNNDQLPPDSTSARQLRALVMQALDRSAMFLSMALPNRIFPPHFNRYGAQRNHYGPHVDGAIRRWPGEGSHLRSDLAATLFLSDPESYDGGELVIGAGLAERRIKLPAGHMVLYSADSIHQVTPVTRGQRHGAFFWVESMVRSATQRQLLHELDMSILALRQRHGDDTSTVALTGTYHKLLRMWAET
jgi:PKHD-type hydroxylase